MDCLLILLLFHGFLILIKSNLSTISFMDHAFVDVPKQSLLHSKSSGFFLCEVFFLVLHFTFSSVIHFVKFVKRVNSAFRFISLHMDVQLFLHHLLRRLSLIHCISFIPFSKIS